MNDLYWPGIRAFNAVAEFGSFTAAAEATGHSKANLSQQVTELESRLGVQLFYRTTRQLRLTEIGEGYYEKSNRALLELEAASAWASQSTDEIKGLIRVNAVGGAIGEDLIAPLIIKFQKQHPGVEVHLDFSSNRVDLPGKHYDLVVRLGRLSDSSLIARKLCTMNTRYVASPRFLQECGPIRKPEDLKTLPLIYGSVDHWIFTRGGDQRIIQARHGIKVVSGRVMRQAAIAGLGVTRLADVYVQADLDKGQLQEVLPTWSETTPLSLVCPPARHQLYRVSSLMDWLKNHFESAYEQALRSGPGFIADVRQGAE